MLLRMLILLLLPLLGTGAGAALVFFMKEGKHGQTGRRLSGFAAGVMTAASVWSLLLPALNRSAHLGRAAFVPAAVGLWLGVWFLVALEKMTERLQIGRLSEPTGLMALAVTLHNLPEGMAVGAAAAGYRAGGAGLSYAAAMALSVGIALQNLPEGAIISLPLRAEGMKRGKAFLLGILSGVIEPVGAGLTLAAVSVVLSALPVLLGFAAGAMLYAVTDELIPLSRRGAMPFSLGFTLMMALDVALG